MRKIALQLTALLFYAFTALAQNNVQYSEPFDEPEEGWKKVIQVSNGNTFFFNYLGKKGIDVSVYGKDRKLITKSNITGDNWNPGDVKVTKITGLYEVGGSPVLFVQQIIKRTPKLFRITFNPTTGAFSGEEQISELQKFHAGMGFAMVYGGVEPPAFHVIKSPTSDNYAVINFNSISSESDERIEVVYYGMEGNKHKVLTKAYYDAQGFKYVNYISSFVNDKSVFICAYGYNTRNSGGKDSRVIVSRLDQSTGSFTHKQLEFSDDFEDTKGLMGYNPGSGMLQLFTLTVTSKKRSSITYFPLMTYIDPQSLFIVKANPLTNEYVSTHIRTKFNEKGAGYSGMPQNMIINKDNSTTIVQEEMFKVQQQTGAQILTLETQLGNVGLTEFSPEGKETIGYAAKKKQSAAGDISAFNMYERKNGEWAYQQPASLRGINVDFFSFDYVNTAKGKYLIFNDYPENFHKKEGDKMEGVIKASDMNSVFYKLKNGFFEKQFLFAAPKGDDDLKFANIASAHFQDATNTYATLMIERDGKKKVAKIAWVKFD